ncbi:MAG: hypothetical protein ACPLY9_04905 [Nitrososphaerales archaeon]
MAVTLAGKRLHAIAGEGSPEIAPTPMLVRDAELLTGVTVGHRIKKHGIVSGLDYGMKALGDAKSPYTAKGQFKISVNEMVGMLDLRTDGVPTYLFILPDGRTILFTAT